MTHSTNAIKRVKEEAAQGTVLISHTEESFIDIQQSMREMADGIKHLSSASQKSQLIQTMRNNPLPLSQKALN